MKIWVIGRSYPQKINNMQGSFELEQAKMLQKRGNKVAYIACIFHPFKKVHKWGYCTWCEDNLNIFTYSQIYAHERMKLHLDGFQAKVWTKLLQNVEQQAGLPDVIHVHYPANITIAKTILSYKKKGVRIVCTEHWTQVLRKVIDNYEINRLKFYSDHANAFLCVGSPLRESVLELTNTKQDVYVVPNIVNEVFVSSVMKKNGFNFIAVGVLFPHKQFDRIIKAFASQFKGDADVKLTIVGGGVEEVNLKELVKSLGIESQVILTGSLKREDTAKEVSWSNVLICYSNLETFGVPIIEGWACGLPVIATTVAAVREGWDERLGFQISPDDEDELGEKMKYIHEHFDEYDSVYIAEYAQNHYSEDTVYRTLLKYYE